MLVQDYKKLDRDFQETLQEKAGLEDEFRQLERNYETLQRQNMQLDRIVSDQRSKYSG